MILAQHLLHFLFFAILCVSYLLRLLFSPLILMPILPVELHIFYFGFLCFCSFRRVLVLKDA